MMKLIKYISGMGLFVVSLYLINEYQSSWFAILSFWGGCLVAWAQLSPTQDAADGAIGSAKNDAFDVEWVDDKTIRLKPHR